MSANGTSVLVGTNLVLNIHDLKLFKPSSISMYSLVGG